MGYLRVGRREYKEEMRVIVTCVKRGVNNWWIFICPCRGGLCIFITGRFHASLTSGNMRCGRCPNHSITLCLFRYSLCLWSVTSDVSTLDRGIRVEALQAICQSRSTGCSLPFLSMPFFNEVRPVVEKDIVERAHRLHECGFRLDRVVFRDLANARLRLRPATLGVLSGWVSRVTAGSAILQGDPRDAKVSEPSSSQILASWDQQVVRVRIGAAHIWFVKAFPSAVALSKLVADDGSRGVGYGTMVECVSAAGSSLSLVLVCVSESPTAALQDRRVWHVPDHESTTCIFHKWLTEVFEPETCPAESGTVRVVVLRDDHVPVKACSLDWMIDQGIIPFLLPCHFTRQLGIDIFQWTDHTNGLPSTSRSSAPVAGSLEEYHSSRHEHLNPAHVLRAWCQSGLSPFDEDRLLACIPASAVLETPRHACPTALGIFTPGRCGLVTPRNSTQFASMVDCLADRQLTPSRRADAVEKSCRVFSRALIGQRLGEGELSAICSSPPPALKRRRLELDRQDFASVCHPGGDASRLSACSSSSSLTSGVGHAVDAARDAAVPVGIKTEEHGS